MPDWSYHVVFKPVLFALQANLSKRVIMNGVATMGALPGGPNIIDFMGHMSPSPTLAFEGIGVRFPGRIGLGAGLCENKNQLRAFERFGFGFIEIGPVTIDAIPEQYLFRDLKSMSVTTGDSPANSGLDVLSLDLKQVKKTSVPVLVRLAHQTNTTYTDALAELTTAQQKLPEWIAALVIDTRWSVLEWSDQEITEYLQQASSGKQKAIVAVSPDTSSEHVTRIIRCMESVDLNALSITGGTRSADKRVYGRPSAETVRTLVKHLRQNYPNLFLIAGGGVIEPIDATNLLEAGADMVSLYSGLVFSGPGLPKRINELITAQHFAPKSDNQPPVSPYSISSVFSNGWLGIALIGAGLIITGSSAITVALTTVILPYDEQFLGTTRNALISLNANLLPFMSHDRVTYAGAGMSCGILFFVLSCFGARTGQHWAYIAACTSSAFGFASFLLFLGFHYLDPLHTLATLLLVPFFVWALIRPPKFAPMRSSNTRNTKAWYNSLQGQFWFICIGTGLVLAGLTICKVGTSTVFVPEDLMFMKTTADQLLCHNTHLLPTIAHDRAGFGGALVTAGIAVLLSALHGYRQGEGWLWWMFLIGGLPGFLSTLGIHFAIGYTSFIHLLPAYIAAAMFVAGLSLSYRYLCVEPGVDSVTGTNR